MIYKFNIDNPSEYEGRWFALPNILVVKKADKLDDSGMIWCVPVDERVAGWDGVLVWERELTPYARCPMETA